MELESEGMIELSTLQTVTMRSIHLFRCQAGNLEAVRAFPVPSLALTGGEPQTHPSTHVPRHISGAPTTHTNHPINAWNASPGLQGFGQKEFLSKCATLFFFSRFCSGLSFCSSFSYILLLLLLLFVCFCCGISAKTMKLSSIFSSSLHKYTLIGQCV